MSAKTQTLLTIEYVTDHACGNYEIGEIDFGINGALEDYLKQYRIKGRDEIIQKLAFLIHAVHTKSSAIERMERISSASNV